MGYVLKLLAIAKRDGSVIEVRVHPTFLKANHPLAQVNGSFNAVYLHGHACKEMMLQGRGAGDMPTASAVVGDILHAATVDVHVHPTFANRADADESLTFTDDWQSCFFIRLSAQDAPGVLSDIAGCFARENVSIATMLQKGAVENGRVPLIFITHLASEKSMRTALNRLNPDTARLESVIRVEG